MEVRIANGYLQGTAKAISSKSDAHRILIAAALADAPTDVFLQGTNADILATIRCLKGLGCQITQKEQTIHVEPIRRDTPVSGEMDCGESGSTLRFLVPVAAALGGGAVVTGEGRLPQRPMEPLLQLLRQHGCTVQGDKLPLEITGKLTAGSFMLPGNISSQYITGLLFALPLLKEDSEIVLTTQMESVGYVNMTLQTLERFGIHVKTTPTGWKIPGGQIYHSPKEIYAEGDWSNAAFWLTAGAVGKEKVGCSGLDENSRQGDKEILSLLERFGATVERKENTFTVCGKKLQGCVIDASQIPDLVPILCVAAAAAEGKTEIINARRLRLKESDRLSAMADCLQRLQVPVEEKEDGLVIYGIGRAKASAPVTVSSYQDHRIVMAMAIAAVALQQEIVIEGAEAVEKSYPSFFAEFTKLGGAVHVL